MRAFDCDCACDCGWAGDPESRETCDWRYEWTETEAGRTGSEGQCLRRWARRDWIWVGEVSKRGMYVDGGWGAVLVVLTL